MDTQTEVQIFIRLGGKVASLVAKTVKNPPSNAGDLGLIPGGKARIPHALQQLTRELLQLSSHAPEPTHYN